MYSPFIFHAILCACNIVPCSYTRHLQTLYCACFKGKFRDITDVCIGKFSMHMHAVILAWDIHHSYFMQYYVHATLFLVVIQGTCKHCIVHVSKESFVTLQMFA